MKESKQDILENANSRNGGFTVPEGYFEDFATKMASKLPFREELDVPVARQTPQRNSRWLRVRPYVYMAAMFAGAWCLIKMFSLMSTPNGDVTINNYPALSLALEDEQFVDEYILDGVSNFDILEDSYLNSFGDESLEGSDEVSEAEFESPEPETNPSYRLPTDGISTNNTYTE